jgi:hypothetical protein
MRRSLSRWVTVLLVQASCTDQGPANDLGGLVGVWRVDVAGIGSYCIRFEPDRSFAYDIRTFAPEGRPADSLARIERYVGVVRQWSDSIEFSASRWITYSWMQHRTTPLVRDTAASLSSLSSITIGTSELLISEQPGPFALLDRNPKRFDRCGPQP